MLVPQLFSNSGVWCMALAPCFSPRFSLDEGGLGCKWGKARIKAQGSRRRKKRRFPRSGFRKTKPGPGSGAGMTFFRVRLVSPVGTLSIVSSSLCGFASLREIVDFSALLSTVRTILPFLQVIQRPHHHVTVHHLPVPVRHTRFSGNAHWLRSILTAGRDRPPPGVCVGHHRVSPARHPTGPRPAVR